MTIPLLLKIAGVLALVDGVVALIWAILKERRGGSVSTFHFYGSVGVALFGIVLVLIGAFMCGPSASEATTKSPATATGAIADEVETTPSEGEPVDGTKGEVVAAPSVNTAVSDVSDVSEDDAAAKVVGDVIGVPDTVVPTGEPGVGVDVAPEPSAALPKAAAAVKAENDEAPDEHARKERRAKRRAKRRSVRKEKGSTAEQAPAESGSDTSPPAAAPAVGADVDTEPCLPKGPRTQNKNTISASSSDSAHAPTEKGTVSKDVSCSKLVASAEIEVSAEGAPGTCVCLVGLQLSRDGGGGKCSPTRTKRVNGGKEKLVLKVNCTGDSGAYDWRVTRSRKASGKDATCTCNWGDASVKVVER